MFVYLFALMQVFTFRFRQSMKKLIGLLFILGWQQIASAQSVTYSFFAEPSLNYRIASQRHSGHVLVLNESSKVSPGWRLGGEILYPLDSNIFIQSGLQYANIGFQSERYWLTSDGTQHTMERVAYQFLEVPTTIGWKLSSPISPKTTAKIGLLHQITLASSRFDLRPYQLGITSDIAYHFKLTKGSYWHVGPAFYMALINIYPDNFSVVRPFTLDIRTGVTTGW